MTDTIPQGRIMLRVEEPWWVAYWGRLDDSKADKIELCRVRMNSADNEPEVKTAFIELAKLVITKGVEAVGGKLSHWNDPVRAPEDERGAPP